MILLTSMEGKKSNKVIIIGAGVSGLSCARYLTKYKDEVDVKILEASDRVGGRVRSYNAADGTVLELGAQYIHGTVGNAIYDFAVEKGIINPNEKAEEIDGEDDDLHFFHNSINTNKREASESIKKAIEYKKYLKTNISASNPKQRSLGNYLKQEIKTYLNEQQDLKETQEAVFNHLVLEECDSYGSPSLDAVDLGMFDVYTDLEGDLMYTNTGCYEKIVNALHQDVQDDWILKNHKVTCIEYKEDGGGENNLKVSCENGAMFDCDVVVITVSLEVLRSMIQADNVFKPSLPKEKSKALKHLKLSRVVKMLFKFTSDFPQQNTDCIYLYPTKEFMNETPFSEIHLLERILGTEWWLLWLNGCLLDKFETSNKVEFANSCLSSLKENYREFPQDLKIDPDSITTSDWSDDPLYLGGYSYFEVGANPKEDIQNLRKPIEFKNGNGRACHLLFSGEMTDEKFYSTTHGAFESGLRDGKHIETILNLSQ